MRIKKLSKKNLARLGAGLLPEPSEDEVQAIIVTGLRLHGYKVLITSRRRKACRACGAVSHDGDGASKGIPDLFVSHRDLAPYIWIAVEVKKPGPIKYSSDEQRVLRQSGMIAVAQSLEDALRIMWDVRCRGGCKFGVTGVLTNEK